MDCEAEKSISVAREAMKAGNYAKAKKFLLKSMRMQETPEAKVLLAQCECYLSSSSQQTRSTTQSSSESTPKEESVPKEEGKVLYSDADEKLCEEIMRKTDYYAILGIAKTATEEEIKKSYRKLALKLHPDKNRAPGANEAFKKVSQSFSCLSNKEKRKIYDEHGTEQEYRQQYRRHFREEEEVDPEDLFDLFFGMGMGRRRRRYYHQSNYRQEAQTRQQPEVLKQFLPLIAVFIVLFAMMFANLKSSGNDFKYAQLFSLNKKYTNQAKRFTERAEVGYYVDNDFKEKYGKDKSILHDIEHEVEIMHLNAMQNACWKAENRRKNIRIQLEYYYQSESSKRQLMNELRRIDFAACEEYQRVYDIIQR